MAAQIDTGQIKEKIALQLVSVVLASSEKELNDLVTSSNQAKENQEIRKEILFALGRPHSDSLRADFWCLTVDLLYIKPKFGVKALQILSYTQNHEIARATKQIMKHKSNGTVQRQENEAAEGSKSIVITADDGLGFWLKEALSIVDYAYQVGEMMDSIISLLEEYQPWIHHDKLCKLWVTKSHELPSRDTPLSPSTRR